MHVSDEPARAMQPRLGRHIIIAAIVIAIAILVLANEIRFQGCITAQNNQFFHGLTAQKCSRLPWGAKF